MSVIEIAFGVPDCDCCEGTVQCPANPDHRIKKRLHARFSIGSTYTPLPDVVWDDVFLYWIWTTTYPGPYLPIIGCPDYLDMDPGARNVIQDTLLSCGGSAGEWGNLATIEIENSSGFGFTCSSLDFELVVDPSFYLKYDLGTAASINLLCYDDIDDHMFLEFSEDPF